MATTPIRIRDDLYPWVEAEAQRLGVGVAALVNSLVERAAAHGRIEARPIAVPPGLSEEAEKTLVPAPIDSRLILTFTDGVTPWPQVIAGYKKGLDAQSLDLEVFQGGHTIKIPRAWIITWHVVPPNQDFVQAIFVTAIGYRGVGMRLHPWVTLPNREAHGL